MGTGSKKQSSRRRSSAGSKSSAAGENTGRWTEEECDKFEEGLKKFGKQWQLIAKEIPSRTIVQIRTHAQKHFLRLAKSQPEISTSIAHVEEAAQTPKKVSNTRGRSASLSSSGSLGSRGGLTGSLRSASSPSLSTQGSTPAATDDVRKYSTTSQRRAAKAKGTRRAPARGTQDKAEKDEAGEEEEDDENEAEEGGKAAANSAEADSAGETSVEEDDSGDVGMELEEEIAWADPLNEGVCSGYLPPDLVPPPPSLMIKIPSMSHDSGMPSLLPLCASEDYRPPALPHLLHADHKLAHTPRGHNKPSPTSVADLGLAFPDDHLPSSPPSHQHQGHNLLLSPRGDSSGPLPRPLFHRWVPTTSFPPDAFPPHPLLSTHDQCGYGSSIDSYTSHDTYPTPYPSSYPTYPPSSPYPRPPMHEDESSLSSSCSSSLASLAPPEPPSGPLAGQHSGHPSPTATSSRCPSEEVAMGSLLLEDSMEGSGGILEPLPKRARSHGPSPSYQPTPLHSQPQQAMQQQGYVLGREEETLLAELGGLDEDGCLDFGVLDEVLGLLSDDEGGVGPCPLMMAQQQMQQAMPPRAYGFGDAYAYGQGKGVHFAQQQAVGGGISF